MMLPPTWTLYDTYAIRHATGHATFRHADRASIVAQAWRIEQALAGVAWTQRPGMWEQAEMFKEEEDTE